MSAWAQALSSGIQATSSAINEFGGTAFQAYYNRKAADVAWDRNRTMMQKGHQWEVRDLRKAGLNPILSAGGSPPGGSAPSAAPVGKPSAEALELNMLEILSTAKQIEEANARIDATKAQENKTNAETKLLKHDEQKAGTMAGLWNVARDFLGLGKSTAKQAWHEGKKAYKSASEFDKKSGPGVTFRNALKKAKRFVLDITNPGIDNRSKEERDTEYNNLIRKYNK